MRIAGWTILKFLLMRLASATLMLVLVSGQSELMLPPDATDHLLECLPQAAACSEPVSGSSAAIAESAELPP